MTYVDLGFEFYPSGSVNVPLTGLWTSDPTAEIGHAAVLEAFVGSNEQKTRYRLDEFSLMRGLEGFSYNMPGPSGEDGAHPVQGVTKITAYLKIKQPFYHRRANSNRMGKDFSALEI